MLNENLCYKYTIDEMKIQNLFLEATRESEDENRKRIQYTRAWEGGKRGSSLTFHGVSNCIFAMEMIQHKKYLTCLYIFA